MTTEDIAQLAMAIGDQIANAIIAVVQAAEAADELDLIDWDPQDEDDFNNRLTMGDEYEETWLI